MNINNSTINVYIFDNRNRKSGFIELNAKEDGLEIKRSMGKFIRTSFVRYSDIKQAPMTWSSEVWEVFFICIDKLFSQKYSNRLEAEDAAYELFFEKFNLSLKHPDCNSNETTPLSLIRHILSHYCKAEKICDSGTKVGCNVAFECYKNFLYYTDHKRSDFLIENLELEDDRSFSKEQIRDHIMKKYGDSHFYKKVD